MDNLKLLGVRRNATKDEIRAAFRKKVLETSTKHKIDDRYTVQLIREAYRDLMKGFGMDGHLAAYLTWEDLKSGFMCRCGSKYNSEYLTKNVVECQSCSCYVEIV